MISRRGSSEHLDVSALQRAVDRLVERHEALRARNASEQTLFDATYSAASLWQLWCSSGQPWTNSHVGILASWSVYNAWPRTIVLPVDSPGAQISLLRPTVG